MAVVTNQMRMHLCPALFAALLSGAFSPQVVIISDNRWLPSLHMSFCARGLKPLLLTAFFHQVVHGIFQSSRSELILQHERHKQALRIVIAPEARHGKEYLEPIVLFHLQRFEIPLFRHLQSSPCSKHAPLSCIVLAHATCQFRRSSPLSR
jgi:hypothetical protein